MQRIYAWGRLKGEPHEIIPLFHSSTVQTVLSTHQRGLAFGMGRSYGDVCLNPNGKLWTTRLLDKFIHFDSQTGRLICQAGVTLREIQHLVIPHGWSLAVTPGTLWVTVGGAIANDVHGKNHHRFGTFGAQVCWMRLVRTDGQVIECGPHLNVDWYQATVGGIGLTGVIVEVVLQLRRVASAWLDTEIISFSKLDDFFALAQTSEPEWEYTASWIDCTQIGRGLFLRANWSEQKGQAYCRKKELAFPFVSPVSFVNRLTLKPLNSLYYHLNKRQTGRSLVHYEQFLYPLDRLLEWNRLYGPKGFYQYQVVLDRAVGQAALNEILFEIKRSKAGSCLVVLKTFGERPALGVMSFVKPGVTLAIDFANQGESTLALLKRLDDIVRLAKGRIYLAKDACMSSKLFEESYPGLTLFLKYRDLNISSGLSRRLGLG